MISISDTAKCEEIKDAGINVTATAIFTQQQAILAANAGSQFYDLKI
jgi:transaldolase